MYNNIRMYLNIVLFDNSIISSITYHMLSMGLRFMISLEILTRLYNSELKEYLSTTRRMDVSSTHQFSFVCILNVAMFYPIHIFWPICIWTNPIHVNMENPYAYVLNTYMGQNSYINVLAL